MLRQQGRQSRRNDEPRHPARHIYTQAPGNGVATGAKARFHFSYQRYLINQIRENFGLEHTPIRLVIRERGSGEVGAKDV